MNKPANTLENTVRPQTITKYLNAALELDQRICKKQEIGFYAFAREFNLSNNALREFCEEGFFFPGNDKTTVRGMRAITEHNIRLMLERRNTSYYTLYRVNTPTLPEAEPINDSVQETPDSEPVKEKPTGSITREEFNALIERVSNIEQLLIKQGAAV